MKNQQIAVRCKCVVCDTELMVDVSDVEQEFQLEKAVERARESAWKVPPIEKPFLSPILGCCPEHSGKM